MVPTEGRKQRKRKALDTQSSQEHVADFKRCSVAWKRFLSTSTSRTCRGTTKKHSTQNTQFACILFLFLLPDARAAFYFCFDAALSLLFLLLCANKAAEAVPVLESSWLTES